MKAKALLACAAAAGLLGGCATYYGTPYGYSSYGYATSTPAYGYYDYAPAPYYGGPYWYDSPAVVGGFTYYGGWGGHRDRDKDWHDGRDWRGHGGRESWRGDGERESWRGDRRGEWRGGGAVHREAFRGAAGGRRAGAAGMVHPAASPAQMHARPAGGHGAAHALVHPARAPRAEAR